MEDVLIPIVLFLSLAIVFWGLIYFKYRSKSELQQTIRMALEKGTELSPEIIDRMGEPEPHRDRDLRRSLVWLALGIATFVLGFGLPADAEEGSQVLLAVAAFPICIGIAFMIMWRYGNSRN